MTTILTSIVSCRVLGFAIPFVRSCWGHVKSCQHAKYGFEVYVSLTSISIKETQSMWTKKSGKGWHEWHKACIATKMPEQKFEILVKIQFASQVILFQEIGIQAHQCFLLQKSTIIGTSRLCITKSKRLRYNPNCCRYFGSCGPTMCVEPNSRLLASF